MNNDDTISTLNDLIATCKDGEAGFKICVADASSRHSPLGTLFADRQLSCARAAVELQDLVRSAGGVAQTGSGVGAALHRRWVNIKTTIKGKNDGAVLAECEKAAECALYSYRKALEKGLPPPMLQVVERQYQGVLHNHHQIKILRDQLKVNF